MVDLPADVGTTYQVFRNGVPQRPGIDFERSGRSLVFEGQLTKDKVSGWRWFLGAWGVGTYRQDDTIDVRYEVEGQTRLAHRLEIRTLD